jgi:hypothetical protein
MSKRPSKPTKDLNVLAHRIIAEATDEDEGAPAEPEQKPDDGKDPNAVALGRKGGLKGGRARAAKLSAKQRSAAAKKAARARWGKP